MDVSSSRRIAKDLSVFDFVDQKVWDDLYDDLMNEKYKKNTRNFSRAITGKEGFTDKPLIFVVPRQRGGSSYKLTRLLGIDDNSVVQYCPISKGYSMQDVSSFTLGPVVGEGLNIVNSAFSKTICVSHLEGGFVNYKRKNFWQKKALRKVHFDGERLEVDGEDYDPYEWLEANEELWRPEWEKWRRSIALSSEGSFHWEDGLGDIVTYASPKGHNKKYIDFVEWKWSCYIQPALELIPATREYKFMKKLISKGVPIGLVHPKGMKIDGEEPMTTEGLLELFNDKYDMACMPYVVAYSLLQ